MDSHMITCCSIADLPTSYLTERSVPYFCFHLCMNGMEYDDDLGKLIFIENLYEDTRQEAMSTTSRADPEQYEAMFESILKGGKDITHTTFLSGMFGTCNSVVTARDGMLERYPGRRIAVIDSCCASVGYGLPVDTAWERMQADANYEELVSWIEESRKRVRHWFFISDLTHLRRGGHISVPAVLFGNMPDICPLMNVNVEGKLIPHDEHWGKKRVIREMVERMGKHARQGTAHSGKCLLSQSSCPEDVGAVAGLMEETSPQLNGKVFITGVGTVIGSHIGPGTICLVFWGDERTA